MGLHGSLQLLLPYSNPQWENINFLRFIQRNAIASAAHRSDKRVITNGQPARILHCTRRNEALLHRLRHQPTGERITRSHVQGTTCSKQYQQTIYSRISSIGKSRLCNLENVSRPYLVPFFATQMRFRMFNLSTLCSSGSCEPACEPPCEA